MASENLANRIDPARAAVAASAPPSRAKKIATLGGQKAAIGITGAR